MNKQQFMQRFSFHDLSLQPSTFKHLGHAKEAGVLIPLVAGTKGLEVILTRRASHLKHHPGQISFPGGKVEPEDLNLQHTALREAQEEIGLSPSDVDVFGQLPQYQTLTGYVITPILGFIPSNYDFKVDSNEVAEVFQVPFSHFINERNHLHVPINRDGHTHTVYFMPYLHYNIWGATAAIMKDLVTHLKLD
ncbi:CoA pyrophosphatase [Thalassotalea aquiviva]|uniref:CoA pyrophosphatase n=1 Tax=Thalassotalea aquiviva TaxID=3242415 RepID=UPI00352AEAE7